MRNTKKDTSPSSSSLAPVALPEGGRPSSSAPPQPPGLDLSRYSEATRRALYDIVVAVFFPAISEEVRRFHEKEGSCGEAYSPDESELVVFYLFGSYAESLIMPGRLGRVTVSH